MTRFITLECKKRLQDVDGESFNSPNHSGVFYFRETLSPVSRPLLVKHTLCTESLDRAKL